MKKTQSSFLRALVFSTLLLTGVSSFAQKSGGESGGGGGVLLSPSGPVLLDFFNIDVNFKDSKNLQGLSASRVGSPVSDSFVINRTTSAKLRQKHPAFELALGTLERWQAMYFDVAGIRALTALQDPLQWSFVETPLSAAVHFPPGVAPSAPTAIAAYYQADAFKYTVTLNRKLWNELGVFSQAGLIIHEGLRHLQIAFSDRFNEESLQRATALFMMCEPKPRLSYYIQYLMLNDRITATRLYGEFDQLVKTDCVRR